MVIPVQKRRDRKPLESERNCYATWFDKFLLQKKTLTSKLLFVACTLFIILVEICLLRISSSNAIKFIKHLTPVKMAGFFFFLNVYMETFNHLVQNDMLILLPYLGAYQIQFSLLQPGVLFLWWILHVFGQYGKLIPVMISSYPTITVDIYFKSSAR